MTLHEIAAQLRQPSGEAGHVVAENMNRSNARLTERAFRRLNVVAGTSVLEIGPGNGRLLPSLFAIQPDFHYVGVDFSALMVAEAQQANAHYVGTGQAAFILANADALPFGDATFHYVFTANTLYFWPDPLRTLTEIRRVLRPGGTLVLAIRSADTMRALPFTQYGFRLYNAPDVVALLGQTHYVAPQVESWMEATTFQDVSVPLESVLVVGHKPDA